MGTLNRDRYWTILFNIALPLLLSTAAIGQERAEELEPVIVSEPYPAPGLNFEAGSDSGSRLGIKVKETPASVEIFSNEVLRERGDLNAQSAVSRATGITPAGAPGDGSSAVVARGFYGPTAVMQLYDGTRLYVAAATITFPVDTWVLDRVEVLRGPASVLYGEGAIGGAINFVPRQPNRDAASYDLIAAGGSYDTYRLGLAASGPVTDRAAYQIAAIGTKSDGWVDRGESERATLASSFVFDVTKDFNLKFSVDGTVNRPDRYFGTPLVDGRIDSALREKNYNVENSVIRYEDLWTRVNANWRISPSVTLRNELYRLSADRHWRNVEGFEFLPALSQVRRSVYIEIFHDMRQVGNRFDVSVNDTVFGRKNRFLAGFDYNRIRFVRTSNTPFGGESSVDAFNFSPGLFLNDDPTQREFMSRVKQYSLFAEDYFEVTSSFKALAGIRYEKIDFSREDFLSATSFDKKFSPTTWRLGAIYSITSDTNLYGQVSHAVEPLGDLVTLGGDVRNFDLTKARQYEIGLKKAFMSGRGEVTFALYDIVKKGLLVPDVANPGFSVPVGKQSSRGVEASLKMAINRTLTVDANVAALRAQLDDFGENTGSGFVSRNGNQPINVPQRAANLWLTHSPTAQWRWGGGARYVGPRFADNANTIRIPAYTVVDAFVSYSPNPHWTFSLRGRNLGDRDYAIASYYTNTQFILGEPRSFELVAEASF
jgi:iron complex outermembrane recepter protein